MRLLNPVLICVIVVGLLIAGSALLILHWKHAEKEAITATAPPESANKMLARQFLDSAKKAIAAGELEDAEKKLDEVEGLAPGDPALQEFNTAAARVRAEIADLRKKAEEAFFKGRAELHEAAIMAAAVEIEKLSKGCVLPHSLVEQLTKSVPVGVWYRSLVPTVDNKPSQFYAEPLRDSLGRITMNIAGYAEGSTMQEMDRKLTQLLKDMRTQLGIPDDGEGPNGAVKWGLSPSINARFDPPRLLATTLLNTPYLPPSMTPSQTKVFKPTSKALDFSLRLSFDVVVHSEPYIYTPRR